MLINRHCCWGYRPWRQLSGGSWTLQSSHKVNFSLIYRNVPLCSYVFVVLSAFARLRQSQRNKQQPDEQHSEALVVNEGDDEQDVSIRTRREQVERTLTRKQSKNSRSSLPVIKQKKPITPSEVSHAVQPGTSSPYDAALPETARSLEDSQMPILPAPILQVPITQLSSFKPTKTNFQKKPGGKFRLVLSEGDVCPPRSCLCFHHMLISPASCCTR